MSVRVRARHLRAIPIPATRHRHPWPNSSDHAPPSSTHQVPLFPPSTRDLVLPNETGWRRRASCWLMSCSRTSPWSTTTCGLRRASLPVAVGDVQRHKAPLNDRWHQRAYWTSPTTGGIRRANVETNDLGTGSLPHAAMHMAFSQLLCNPSIVSIIHRTTLPSWMTWTTTATSA